MAVLGGAPWPCRICGPGSGLASSALGLHPQSVSDGFCCFKLLAPLLKAMLKPAVARTGPEATVSSHCGKATGFQGPITWTSASSPGPGAQEGHAQESRPLAPGLCLGHPRSSCFTGPQPPSYLFSFPSRPPPRPGEAGGSPGPRRCAHWRELNPEADAPVREEGAPAPTRPWASVRC